MCRAICPHTKWPHLFCFPNSSGYFFFFFINVSGASLVNKWLRRLDVGPGPHCSWSVTSFTLCCPALGLQVAPPMERAQGPG